MKTYELIENATYEDYLAVESELIQDFVSDFTNVRLVKADGTVGFISGADGKTFDELISTINFDGQLKRFQLSVALKIRFIHFENEKDLQLYNEYESVSTELRTQWIARSVEIDHEAREAKKALKAEERAKAKFAANKAKAIAKFDDMVQSAAIARTSASFFYALGWLTKHIGSLSATLPDYLGSAFEKHFGADTPKTLVDSEAKTSGGYAKQWSWEFKCTLKGLKGLTAPEYITTVTSDYTKGIHNTAFLWDLVDNYGFKFGTSQDVDSIVEHIPEEYQSIFYTGYAA